MYDVRWEDSALAELADIWTEADSPLRKVITTVTRQIDLQLQADPLLTSESRPGGRYVLFASPLGITFRIENDGRTVSVLRVWLFRKRK
jgi:hypothetical protein